MGASEGREEKIGLKAPVPAREGGRKPPPRGENRGMWGNPSGRTRPRPEWGNPPGGRSFKSAA